MAICKDPSLTFLNKHGYNVVRLPRAGIRPLDVLGRDRKSLERLGSLEHIWLSEVEAPAPAPPQPAASVSGQNTADMKLSVGLQFLSNVLGAMGASVPQVGFAYNRAKSVQFTLTNVLSIAVEPFALGSYLAAGDLDESNPFVRNYFEDEEAQAFVISEVLVSDSLSTVAKGSSGAEIEVDAPAIQEVVGANVKVRSAGSSSTNLTYTGRTPLTFGFKAFGIAFVDGGWAVQGIKPSGDLSFGLPGEVTDVSPVLFSEGGRIALR